MVAQHDKAGYWVNQGIFDGLTRFHQLEERIDAIEERKDRGDIFEIFVEGYLSTQAITQHVKHWIVGNIPLEMRKRYNLPNDVTGIDGIYEGHDGNHVAYQIKYRKRENLTFAEVAPFLGITEKFADRVIFTNASKLSEKAAVRTRWFSSAVFDQLSENSLKQIEAWLKERKPPKARFIPDPNYQVQALADIEVAFERHTRATVVMACGTGKTLVALWAAERTNPKTVLILLPSLMLLQQTLREWSQQTSWGSRFSYLCVCSDKTVGLKNDDMEIDKSETGFRIDTDPTIVREFLRRETQDIKVIFSTYQSSDVVAQGAKDLPPIDLAIFDEAHKTTGRSRGTFSHALSDENIHIKKRLFLTATPRHFDIRKRDKEGDFRVLSMDDESIYGPRAHTLSFATAADKEITCKYKVIISKIDKRAVDDFTRKSGITLIEGDEIGARWVANLIALDRAVDKVKPRKIITFHARVKLAQEFAKDEPRGIAFHLETHDVFHVNGKQNSAERGRIISAFETAPQALITNARCLTEGIDISAIDMVAFIDPKRSPIDIAQAVGRTMRKPRSSTTKTVGYVLVPLFAGIDGESIDDAIQSEGFDVVVDVLNGLQEHDEDFVDIVREIRQRKGEGRPFDPKRFEEKVEVIGPRIGFEELVKSIGVAIADRIGSSWDESFGWLVKYKARTGDCAVPAQYREGDHPLGIWVSTQRGKYKKGGLSSDHRRRLDEIGFEWDVHATKWETGFSALKIYAEREGNCRPPEGFCEGEYPLAQWVYVQRASKDSLSPERRRWLDEIGFEWDVHATKWETGFSALKIYAEREGNCHVPQRHKEGGFALGHWLHSQRTTKDDLSSDGAPLGGADLVGLGA